MPIEWQEAVKDFVAKHSEPFEPDQGDFSDQIAWKMFALHLTACVQCCKNRVEVVEELLHLVKTFEAAHKFPQGLHAQLSLFFTPDDGIGELLIGDLERRKRGRDDT